jgi:hypothetical protein
MVLLVVNGRLVARRLNRKSRKITKAYCCENNEGSTLAMLERSTIMSLGHFPQIGAKPG